MDLLTSCSFQAYQQAVITNCRFEDEEPGERKRPATAGATSNLDDDWLGLAAGNQQKRPLGLASTIDFSSGGGDDWLDMAAGSSSR